MDFFRAFRTPTKFAQEFLFFSDGLGHQKSKDFLIDREHFENYLVMYVLSGKLHVEQNGHFILKKGQGVIMRLTQKHTYYTDEIETCEFLWMHFNGRQADMYMNFLEQKSALPLIFKEERVEQLIRHAFTLFDKDNKEREFYISEAIYSILLSIIHSICKENDVFALDYHTEFMNKAITYIENNIYTKFQLIDLANHFNMSQFHFCKVFEKHFHVTPMKYVLMKKIEISKYLLSYTNESISHIANSLNFADQSHFSKAFKSIESLSPLAFRNMKA